MTSRTRIVVDWGSTNFRAYGFAGDGALERRHQAAAGILTVGDRDFAAVLEREVGGWLDARCDVYFSGMITSRNGWVETPYVEAPARLEALARVAVTRVGLRGATLHFLPGVAVRHPLPDVMRGEEIQIFGAVAPGEAATVVLPGTHSKWARVDNGAITGFRTFMTGEVFAVLCEHSILGRLIPQGKEQGHRRLDEMAFLAGVRQALAAGSAGLLNDIFTARSGVLLGGVAAEDIADRLSGMIIGHEVKSALAAGAPEAAPWRGQIRLVGEPGLCARYRLALQEAGHDAEIAPEHAAVEGFRRLCALEEKRRTPPAA